MAWRGPEAAGVAAATEIAQAEERLVRDAHDQSAARDAAQLAQRPPRIVQVLEHLGAHDDVEGAVVPGQRTDVGEAQLGVRGAVGGGREGAGTRVDAGDPVPGEPRGEEPVAAARVEDRARALGGREPDDRPQEPLDQRALEPAALVLGGHSPSSEAYSRR